MTLQEEADLILRLKTKDIRSKQLIMEFMGAKGGNLETVQYHSSYDLLIPVIKKIYQLGNHEDYPKYDVMNSVFNNISMSHPGEVYNQILHFLTWYKTVKE